MTATSKLDCPTSRGLRHSAVPPKCSLIAKQLQSGYDIAQQAKETGALAKEIAQEVLGQSSPSFLCDRANVRRRDLHN